MKTAIFAISLLIQLSFSTNAQYQVNNSDRGNGFYINPIFAGDYPDPSLLRDGNDYYIVHSSFEYYPGLLIWHSKDLINWTPVTNALQKYVGSVWAPDLVKYKNKYYIYFPANNTNYVVTADSIKEPKDQKSKPGSATRGEDARLTALTVARLDTKASSVGRIDALQGPVGHLVDGIAQCRQWFRQALLLKPSLRLA